jgi:hypothetical protein
MATYELIAKSINTGTVSSVTFSSISSSYTDLKLVYSNRGSLLYTSDSNYARVRPNNVTSGYYGRYLVWDIGANSMYTAGTLTGDGYYGWATADGFTSGIFANGEIYICDYASTSTFKPAMSMSYAGNNAGNVYYSGMYGTLYRANTAISSLVISNVNGDFIANSNFYLYGIKNTNT